MKNEFDRSDDYFDSQEFSLRRGFYFLPRTEDMFSKKLPQIIQIFFFANFDIGGGNLEALSKFDIKQLNPITLDDMEKFLSLGQSDISFSKGGGRTRINT